MNKTDFDKDLGTIKELARFNSFKLRSKANVD